jgi:hypothetical protein
MVEGLPGGDPEMTVTKTANAVFGLGVAVLIGAGALIIAGVLALAQRAKNLATAELS